jgi:hypothetical protein
MRVGQKNAAIVAGIRLASSFGPTLRRTSNGLITTGDVTGPIAPPIQFRELVTEYFFGGARWRLSSCISNGAGRRPVIVMHIKTGIDPRGLWRLRSVHRLVGLQRGRGAWLFRDGKVPLDQDAGEDQHAAPESLGAAAAASA